jgi:hypothetical protein
MTHRLPIFLTIVFLLALPAAAQDLNLQTAAIKAGLEYTYDRFDKFEGVHAQLSPSLILSYSGYVTGSHRFFITAKSRDIGYEDNATFLIDGRRLRVEPPNRHYLSFTAALDSNDFAAMCQAEDLAVKIGSYVHEFSKEERQRLAALLKVASSK